MAALALTLQQASAVSALTQRHLLRLDEEGSGPPRSANGAYPAVELGKWLKSRNEGDKQRLIKAQADLAEMEADKARGTLCEVDKVEDMLTERFAACRARLLTIAPTVAPRIAGASMAAQAQAEIQKAIYQALDELANDSADLRRPEPRVGASPVRVDTAA